MIYLLDTNAFSAILRRRQRSLMRRFEAVAATGAAIRVPVIVLHELHYGAWRSPYPAQNLERIEALLQDLHGVVPFGPEEAQHAGQLRAHLAARGEGIGPFDSLIAAQALSLDATLVTGNVREFARVPGLKWEDWSEEMA